MKVLGLITEYNPFHNGHKYHLYESKKLTSATHTIAIMSGNFLQRGEPAITDKWTRAEMAVREGVDLVIELPTVYACNSAEFFAYGAVSLLHKLNIVNCLCFGSEKGALEKLQKISKILVNEPLEYKNFLKDFLSKGIPYPQARSKALNQFLKDPTIEEIIQSPNNILGIEYLKSLLKLNSPIVPFTIKRIKAEYHSTHMDYDICSATAIRKFFDAQSNKSIDLLRTVMPAQSFDCLSKSIKDGRGPILNSDLNNLLLYKLRSSSLEDLTKILNVNEGLENRIKEASHKAISYHALLELVKTKRYTYTRLQRIFMHLILGITLNDITYFQSHRGPQYARILGFSKSGAKLIKLLKQYSSIPILTNINRDNLDNDASHKMLAYDVLATDIFSLNYPNAQHRIGGWDYYHKPYIHK